MKYVITNAIILDGTKDMKPLKGFNIFVDDGRITEISEKNDFSGYKIHDLSNKYIMPGLINLHVHLPGSGKPKNKRGNPAKLVNFLMKTALTRSLIMTIMKSYAKTELMSGVTTIRTVGGIDLFDSKLRDLINNNKALGPRILASNEAISPKNGHMVGSVARKCETLDDIKTQMEKLIASKPDYIKLMITGGVLDAEKEGEPGVLRMTPEFVKYACDIAHANNLKVAAHVESPIGVKVALENGVDTIEHGSYVDEEMIQLYKNRKAAQVLTISPASPYVLLAPEVTNISKMEEVNSKVVLDGMIQSAKACLENDIPLGLGTDTGCAYATHYNMWRELIYFKKFCGVSNSFVLHTATLVNASIVGIDKETGSIETGKSADFIVTSNNPLEDLFVLENIEAVVFRGKIINHPKYKKYKKVEKELNILFNSYK